MKKRLLGLMPFVLAACSSNQPQNLQPLDMQAVVEYQQRVATAKTDIEKKEEFWDLDHSDRCQKVQVVHHYLHTHPALYYGYRHELD